MFITLFLNAIDILAEEKDEKMIEFAMGGICNCCPDIQNKTYLLENECVDFTVKCLSRYGVYLSLKC